MIRPRVVKQQPPKRRGLTDFAHLEQRDKARTSIFQQVLRFMPRPRGRELSLTVGSPIQQDARPARQGKKQLGPVGDPRSRPPQEP